MKIIKIQDIIIKYDLENIIKDANNISYKKDNYINNHRNGDGLPYKDAPSEKQFIEMRTAFINNILSIEKENKLTDLISENLKFLQKQDNIILDPMFFLIPGLLLDMLILHL